MPADTQTTPPLPLGEPQRARIAEICLEFVARKLSLFGSLARGEATPQGDADVLVKFDPTRRASHGQPSALPTHSLPPVFDKRTIDPAIVKMIGPVRRPSVPCDLLSV